MSFAISQPRELGLSKKEKQNYSLLNALGHIQKGNWNELGLEREASDAIANRLGKQPRGINEDLVTHEINIGLRYNFKH